MWKIIKCYFGYHNLYVVQTLGSQNVQKVACARCKKVWAVHHGMQAMLPWTKEFDHLYYEIFKIKEIKPWR